MVRKIGSDVGLYATYEKITNFDNIKTKNNILILLISKQKLCFGDEEDDI